MQPQQQTKPLLTIHEQRRKAMKQKEDTLQTVLTTAKSNPKFIKLLIYSLNSLEGFVSPPNREIRVNANIIIRLEGVDILRMITLANVKNEQIVTQAGYILWKLMSICDIIDFDLAKLFADKDGHKAVIEILLTKDKSVGSSLPYIRILNGLVQIPQLISKLLESGLAETIKKINELYPDDLDIVAINFDTMNKISNQKAGRDLIIEKDLVQNILDNIMQCAKAKNTKGVLSGLTVIDNLARNENGKEAIIRAKGIEFISNILDMFENDDRILKKCAKIYSKIAKTEDMLHQLELLRKYYSDLQGNPQCDNFKDISKALVLISNFMLVEEIGQILMEPNNLKLLCDLFNFICKINLEGKSTQYIEAYVLLNKYFMIIFKRLFQAKPELAELNKELLPNIENSFCKNWESVKKIVESSNEGDAGFMKSFMSVFRLYFCSYNDILYQCHRRANSEVAKEDSNYITMLLYIIQHVILNGKMYFDVHVESNFVASRILKSAIDISKQNNSLSRSQELTQAVESSYYYMLNLFNISEHNETLSNTLDVIYYLLSQEEFKQRNIETIIPVVVHFMNTKQKYRYPNLICMRILDFFLTPEFIEIYLKHGNPNQFPTHGLNYVNCIVSVMTKQFYQTSASGKAVNAAKLDSSEEAVDFYSNESIENSIATLGTELLRRLIDTMEFKKILRTFKENAESFNPQNSSNDAILQLENSLLTLYSIIGIKEYYDLGVTEILESLKALIQKEITYIENFKRDKQNEKNPNYKDIVSGSSKRLTVELALTKMIYGLSVQKENYANILLTQDICQHVLMKSSDIKNLINIVNYIKSHVRFITQNERELKPKAKGNETFIDRICETYLSLLRRLIEEEDVVENIIKALISFIELKKETCNYLVKGGCPRLLLQVMETTSKPTLAHQAIILLKLITMSNEQNLTMVANQNTLLKLFELRAKFVNEEKITADCDLISNEILKLPGQEKYASEVLLEAIGEFNNNAGGDYSSNETKTKLLNSLELINAFSSNKKQVEFLMVNNQFYKNLNEVTAKTIGDAKVSQIGEKLMTNEISIYKKLKENVDDFDQNVMVSKLIDIITKKSNYRDILINSARLFSGYLREEQLYNKYVDGKINNGFIDTLFEINENYLDDVKVSKEINNILCYLCLRNEKFADYIKSKGGLANVLEELRMNLSINDVASQQLKLNALRMLDSLCRDDKSMELFVKANGVNLIHNMIRNEMTIYPKVKDKEVYMTNEPIQTREKAEKAKQETYFSYCVKIIKNGLDKGYKEFIDEKQMKNLVVILNAQYPNSSLYKEIADICLKDNIPLMLTPKYMILLLKCALSIEARFANDQNIYSTTDRLLSKMSDKITNNKDYANDLSKEIKTYLAKGTDTGNLEYLNRLVTYLSLVVKMPNYSNVLKESKGEIVDLYKKLVNLYGDPQAPINESLSEGVVLSLIMLGNYLTKNAKDSIDVKDTVSKLLSMGQHYYRPENNVFTLKFLNEFDKLLTSAGKEIAKEPKVKYTPENLLFLRHVHSKSFDYFNKTHATLKETHNINSIDQTDKEIITKTLGETRNYLITPDDNDEKSKNSTRFATCIFNHIDDVIDASPTMDKNELKKEEDLLWDIVKLMFTQEYSKGLIENSDTVKTAFKSMNKCKENDYNNYVFNEIINEISKNMENSTELFEKIIKPIEVDLTASPKQNLTINLETLANISKFSSAAKVILRSSSLWKELNTLYSTDKDIKHRRLLATIYSNVMKNSYNLDLILCTEPETFKYIGEKVSIKDNILTDKNDWDIARMEVDTICNIMQDQNNYKQITQKNLITNEDMQKGIDNYKGVNPELSKKLEDLMKKIEDFNQQKKEEVNYKYDEETLSQLTNKIEKAFDEHMNMLGTDDDEAVENKEQKTSKQLGMKKQQSKIVQTGAALQTSSTINQSRLSLISKTLFFNDKNAIITSPLSIRNSQDMSSSLDSVLALIRLMYNSNKTSQEQDIKVKREELIVQGLRLIKLLSVCEDNHKAILELGLINFMERIVLDNIQNKRIYIATLDIMKNCTWSENAVLVLLESPLLDKLIEEVLDLYTQPQKLVNNDELCTIFLYQNMNFSNLCRSKKGFDEVFKKIGLDKLRQLGTVTGNVVLLTSIIDMIINYLRNNENVELSKEFLVDIIKICEKGLSLEDRTAGLVTKTVRLIGMIYQTKYAEDMKGMKVVPLLCNEFPKYKCEPDFLLDIIFTLSKMCAVDPQASSDCVDLNLLEKIVDEVKNNSDQNDILIENFSLLLRNLVSNNPTNCEKLCKDDIINFIMKLIEKYSIRCKNKPKTGLTTLDDKLHGEEDDQSKILIENRILINLINTLDSLTGIQISVDYLAKSSSFLKTLVNTIDRAVGDIEIVKIALHSIGNYFYKDTRKDWKHFEIEQLYSILKYLQKQYYANSEVLTSINHISGYILKGFDSMLYTTKYYGLIMESIKCQDWNLPLVNLALTLIKESLIKHPDLHKESFDETKQQLLNLLRLYFSNSEIQIKCYDILSIYADSPIFSFFIVNSGVIPIAQETIDNEDFNSNDTVKVETRSSLMNLLSILATDEGNAKIISNTLLEKLIREISNEYSEDKVSILKLFASLLRHKKIVDPFIQLNGLPAITKLLTENPDKPSVVLYCFKIIGAISYVGDESKKLLQDSKFNELLNSTMNKSNNNSKILFEAKALEYNINFVRGQKSGKECKEIDLEEIRIEKLMKNIIRPFLSQGKIIKIHTPKGKVKDYHLAFSYDLLKVMCKRLKTNVPPKHKWVIETLQIQKVVKGHGTDLFKKSKTIFRPLAKPEKCFSIIGPVTTEGIKSINAECENEEEVNFWVRYMEIALTYLAKQKGKE